MSVDSLWGWYGRRLNRSTPVFTTTVPTKNKSLFSTIFSSVHLSDISLWTSPAFDAIGINSSIATTKTQQTSSFYFLFSFLLCFFNDTC